MKIKLCLCLAVLLLLTACAGPYTAAVVVRHAEKEKVGVDPTIDPLNPPLSALGEIRAEALMGQLDNIEISAVYATNYLRTIQTATPLAESLGLPVTIYTTPAAVAASVLSDNIGGAVLIVGHSNTVGNIVQAFGSPLPAGLPDPISEEDFDNMATVIINGKGKASAGHTTYGALSPPPP